MRNTFVLAAVVGMLAGAAAWADEALPYGVLSHRMLNTSNDPFPYWVDGRNLQPPTVLIGDVNAAVNAAYQTWEAVSCAAPAFQANGLTSNNPQITEPRDAYDLFNVSAIWITSASDPWYEYALGGGVATAASIPLSYAGTLYQCDIYINAVDYKWSTLTPTPSDALDLQTFVLHEIGHCMGLGHSEDPDDVMSPSAEYGRQRRTLTARDEAKLCEILPQTGAVGSPCMDDADCSKSNLHCVAPPLPDGGTAAKVCSQGCTPTVPGGCPEPFVCKPSNLISGASGACLPTRGDFVTQVGAPCTSDGQCGSAIGLCQPEGELPSGFPLWQGGSCTQNCAPGSAPCPAGSECLDFGGGNMRCMKSCRLGTGDCRQGYSCERFTDQVNLCVPSCHSNADCGGTGDYLCRVCDGTCQPTQNVSATIGDACQNGDQCGAGQFCLLFQLNNQLLGECSQTCATAACTCPPGSSCHALGDGERYCLRDCSGGGQCAPGFQCGLLPGGRACIPMCVDDFDCPVGTRCLNGTCTPPNMDGGSCVLCTTTRDAGNVTPKPIHPDAGDGSGSGGCGCQADPGAIAALLPITVAALFLGARRRKRST